jgi:uncharacterized lipoprotein YbaY
MTRGKRSSLALVTMVALGCSDADADTTPDDPGLVRGRVVRIKTATSYDEPITLGPDSVARVGLYSSPALFGDGSSTLLVEQVFDPASQPPFKFQLSLPLTGPSTQVQYHVAAEIKQHASTSTVGDLVSEQVYVVEPPVDDLVIDVAGLESCDAANAGGFCTLR